MIIQILVIVLLLALSAFFSSCETAISVSSKAKLHHLVKGGSKKAILAERLKDQIGYVINSVLACNTVLNAVATSLAAGLFASLFETWGVACASLVMACLILLYAEVLPKMIAIQRPERLITKFAHVIRFFLIVCKPIAKITNWIARETLTLFRVNQLVIDPPATSVDELRGVIDLHRGADQDSMQERAMLKSILDLRSIQVSEIMVHRKNVTMLNANESIDSIVDQILNSPFSRIPLWEGNTDNIIGIVNVKILLRKVRSMPNKLEEINIREIANNPWFIPDSTDLLEQLQMFRKRREHFALVVDEYGAFLGIVTLEDILEEIVGEIDDEHDICVKGVRKQPDNSVIIDGSVTIRDLNREFDWNLPDDIAATIAGLLINTARMIPSAGQVFMLYGFRLTVLKRQRNQITLVKISKCEDITADREGMLETEDYNQAH